MHFSHEPNSPRYNSAFLPTPGYGPVPKFRKLKSVQDLKPRTNVQPPYRRANPEGGFISVCLHYHAYVNLPALTDRTAASSSNDLPSRHVPNMQFLLQLRVFAQSPARLDQAQ